MSCTTALKDELARFNPQKECCAAAELAAAARGMGELSLLGGGRFGLTLSTEHEPTALRMAALCRRLFGFAPDIALISKRQPRPNTCVCVVAHRVCRLPQHHVYSWF